MRKYMFLLIFILILFQPVFAISLRGATVGETINFEPGLNKTYSWIVQSSYKEPVNIIISKGGTFDKYITLSKTIIKNLKPGESKSFSATFNLPSEIPDLDPGKYRNSICVKEKPVENRTGLSAITSACAIISIQLLYPGKYLNVNLVANNANIGEDVEFDIIVLNLGRENISNVNANIDIFEKENKITSLTTKTISLNSKEKDTISAILPTSSYTPGEYTAIATVFYDGDSKKDNTTFKLGTLDVDILNYTNQAYVNKINPFNIDVESGWNTKIDDIYADVSVSKDGKELTSFKTPSESLDPWKTKTLKGYLDATNNLELGKYDLNITVFYENKSKSQLGKIEIIKQTTKKQRLEISNTTIIISVLIVIIIILAILFLKYAKKRY